MIPFAERLKPDKCYGTIRIGCVQADTPAGPWVSPDVPCLDIRPGKWDSTVVTNPAPLVMEGGLTGEKNAGVHLISRDAVSWEAAPIPKAYSRKIKWDDGTYSDLGHFERPQLLFADEENPRNPTHLLAAMSEGAQGNWDVKRTWNGVIPLKKGDFHE